ncbi:hypothetical protein OG455_27175 [Kitasatospora sp. NBC_01287]|uniref:hypothetical protein n=1 Tax=Kitasatospora sp. NBC_01287 TaxID=2903573 RepID=UPI00224E5E23|nr:hypothetical protein [Kitasatospora sp. NBC_01287]MCX4749146.1 hypothetical protein [Kitasatospora sp. NBC_01287]
MPRITITVVGEQRYHFLWLKYVTGIDLSQHCARSLHGRYSRLVKPDTQHADVHLNEFSRAIAWYLCGVTTPYRWENNPHLALVEAPGHRQQLQVHGLAVELDGVKPIEFDGRHIPPDDPNAGDRAFNTCRNWWFAHHLRAVHGVRHMQGPTPSSGPRYDQDPLL